MKANKVPERIYVHIKDKPFEITFSEVIEKECSNIEYVRIDAFIEKAEKWLNKHILDYVYAKEWGQGVGVEGELFEDFKNYMKE